MQISLLGRLRIVYQIVWETYKLILYLETTISQNRGNRFCLQLQREKELYESGHLNGMSEKLSYKQERTQRRVVV